MSSKPFDIYVRVSRVGGREHLISPEEQETRARQLAHEHGLTVGEVLIDLDESGGKWERPGLQKALVRVKGKKIGGLIVGWLDRLSRDSEHAHRIVREFTAAGGRIYAPDAPDDWTTPEGELQVGILFEFNAYMRKRAAVRLESAKERAIGLGIPVLKQAPPGYVIGPDRRLAPDPETGPVITRMFQMRAAGAPGAELIALLDAAMPTPTGGSHWKRATISGLLKNRVYLGELHYGKDGRFVNTAAHEPLIDRTTWQRAQGTTRKPHPRSYLLAGLLRCDACRHALHGTSDNRADSAPRRWYRCGIHHSTGVCPIPARVSSDVVEAAVLADLFAHLPRIKKAKGRRDDVDGTLATLRKERDEAATLLAQWADPRMQAEIEDLDIYLEGMRSRRQALADAESKLLAETERQHVNDAAHHDLPDGVTWASAWERMPFDRRAALLASQYDCISATRGGDSVIVYPIGTGPVDLPRRGVSADPRPFEQDIPDGARILVLKEAA